MKRKRNETVRSPHRNLNLAKFSIYAEYYSLKTDICKNHGISDGFVCQGICIDEEQGKYWCRDI